VVRFNARRCCQRQSRTVLRDTVQGCNEFDPYETIKCGARRDPVRRSENQAFNDKVKSGVGVVLRLCDKGLYTG